uniref:Uncharacterized protein n=1 Tax=Hydatigena taeniaeformis TaxID=6205 RepID=A0A0R3X1C8_HYDTA
MLKFIVDVFLPPRFYATLWTSWLSSPHFWHSSHTLTVFKLNHRPEITS